MQRVQRFVRWFLPVEEHFFDHVDAAAVATDECARLLLEICRPETAIGQRKDLVERMRDEEHAGDAAMREMADALNRTFVTPLDREDLYALTSEIEGVSDVALATGSQVILHGLGDLPAGALELAGILAECTGRIRACVPLLRNGRNHGQIRVDCVKIEALERDADAIYRREIARNYAEQKDAIQLLKDTEFLEGLENSVDRCASVARVLESILIKNG